MYLQGIGFSMSFTQKIATMKTPGAKKLEERKAEKALIALDELGFDPIKIDDSEINFEYKGCVVKYYPLTEWFSGKSVRDGRGLSKLLKQLHD